MEFVTDTRWPAVKMLAQGALNGGDVWVGQRKYSWRHEARPSLSEAARENHTQMEGKTTLEPGMFSEDCQVEAKDVA